MDGMRYVFLEKLVVFYYEVAAKCVAKVQLSALLELNNNWLRKWTNPLPEPTTTAPNKYIITCVLNEMSALLIDLGSATAPAQDQLLDTLMILLSHSSESVNVSLFWTLKCMCFHYLI